VLKFIEAAVDIADIIDAPRCAKSVPVNE